jgi:hypothetical protein
VYAHNVALSFGFGYLSPLFRLVSNIGQGFVRPRHFRADEKDIGQALKNNNLAFISVILLPSWICSKSLILKNFIDLLKQGVYIMDIKYTAPLFRAAETRKDRP